MDNESDIQPKTIHGDTGAQSEVVFAFAYLLAIKFMPKIRNFKHLNYYRPVTESGVMFKHIDSIFTPLGSNGTANRLKEATSEVD
ncbi:MAG: hypothetical protein LEGION0403_FIIPPAGN_02664 [Legionella sp.]